MEIKTIKAPEGVKELMAELWAKNFEDTISGCSKMPNKYWDEYRTKKRLWFKPRAFEEWQRPQNRSKRKRDYRREKRLGQLRRYAIIEELQQYLYRHGCDFNLWNVLKRCKSFSVATDRSFALEPKDSALYLCDLYSKYPMESVNDISFTIIIVSGGREATLHFDKLDKALRNTFKYPYIIYGDTAAEQITIKIISVATVIPKLKRQNTISTTV